MFLLACIHTLGYRKCNNIWWASLLVRTPEPSQCLSKQKHGTGEHTGDFSCPAVLLINWSFVRTENTFMFVFFILVVLWYLVVFPWRSSSCGSPSHYSDSSLISAWKGRGWEEGEKYHQATQPSQDLFTSQPSGKGQLSILSSTSCLMDSFKLRDFLSDSLQTRFKPSFNVDVCTVGFTFMSICTVWFLSYFYSPSILPFIQTARLVIRPNMIYCICSSPPLLINPTVEI